MRVAPGAARPRRGTPSAKRTRPRAGRRSLAADIARLDRRLAEPGLPPEQRARLERALGELRARLGAQRELRAAMVAVLLG